jgi:diguanylate cyclase (GGDEF)-like protein
MISTIARTPLSADAHPAAHRLAAFSISLALVAISLLAIRFGSMPGPEWNAFLPMIGTAWALADLMTAFLLLTQFYVNGTTFYTVIAAAYAVSGLLTWPYVLAFPGIAHAGPMPLSDQQISIWIWVAWHVTFPVLIVLSLACDPRLSHRIVSHAARGRALWFTIGATFLTVGVLANLIFVARDALPHLVVDGRFEYRYSRVIAPAVVTLNLIACALLARRFTRLTPLQVWLFVAMLAAAMDGTLQCWAPFRYSVAWYVGKVETVSTACVVLAMLLSEVGGLYRRFADMAVVDPLTGLFNRRAYDEHLELTLRQARRRSSELGLIVVDVDFFKGFNDAYGHAMGDECLREIAAILRSAATRPMDHVSRFGGEEFVIIVPDTPPGGVMAVAARIIERTRAARITYAEYALGYVTVSVGVSVLSDARLATAAGFFASADAALFEAKRAGRDTLSVSRYVPAAENIVTTPFSTGSRIDVA